MSLTLWTFIVSILPGVVRRVIFLASSLGNVGYDEEIQ
jgi:hypothetical protein